MPKILALAFLGLVATSWWTAAASASITVATDAQRPALRVDAAGNAEVSWTAGGERRYVLVPPTGPCFPGRQLSGADVSRPAAAPALPFPSSAAAHPRQGALWALQTWRVRPGGPVELRFSRWRGEPPLVALAAELAFEGELLAGRATFAGRAVPLTSPTPEGTRVRSFRLPRPPRRR